MCSDDPNIIAVPWARQIGAVWAQILEAQDLPRDGVVIELAPGVSPKLGFALEAIGFRGRLHVVDASRIASQCIVEAYRRIMPSATVHAVVARIASAPAQLPTQCDALVLNHALDDLILGYSLSTGEFDALFDNWAASPPSINRVRGYWQRAKRRRNELARCADRVHDDLIRIAAHCRPRVIILGEYRSWIHETYQLDEPDRHARVLAQRLGVSIGSIGHVRSRVADGALTGLGYDPERWLVFEA